MDIQRLIKLAHENAKKKGFWEDFQALEEMETKPYYLDMNNNAIGNRLMLITGEVAEAHEALRKGDYENFKEELADIVIRVADLAGGLDIDLEDEILRKMEKNLARPYKHGKKF